jgi:hypothetical protein
MIRAPLEYCLSEAVGSLPMGAGNVGSTTHCTYIGNNGIPPNQYEFNAVLQDAARCSHAPW